MTKLCVGITYYNDVPLLVKHLNFCQTLPEDIEVVIVDDASKHSARSVIKQYYKPIHPNIKIYEVQEDLGFNSHGCRNLIAKVAESDNILFLDIDTYISYNDLIQIRDIDYKYNEKYVFYAQIMTNNYHVWYPGHVNIFSMSKETYLAVNGYDESWTGLHWGDREFFEALEENGCETIHVPATIMIARDGKTVIIDPSLTKAYYTEDTMYQPPPPDKIAVSGRTKARINFTYERIL